MSDSSSFLYDPQDEGKAFRRIGGLISTLYALYRVFVEPSLGDAILGFLGAFVGELSIPRGALSRLIGGQIIVSLRRFFGYGDAIARVLMTLIALGGTSLVVKFIFGLQLIPDNIDFVVKRAGIGLLGVTVALYAAMVVSKFSFELSQIRYDTSTVQHEVGFYFSICAFCVCIALLAGGTDYPDKISMAPHLGPVLLEKGGFAFRLILSFCLIAFIWAICFGANIFSRIFEYYRRDKLLPANL